MTESSATAPRPEHIEPERIGVPVGPPAPGQAEVLREESHQRAIVQALPAAVCACDADGRLTQFNEAAVALWGRAPELGRELWCGAARLFLPDGTPLPLEQCPMATALREGRTLRDVEIVVERPDGERRHVLANPQALFDGAGRVSGAVNMLVDITPLKVAEAALSATRNDLSLQLETLQSLHGLAMRLAGTPDLPAALRDILATLAELHGADSGQLSLLDLASGMLLPAASLGFEPGVLERAGGVTPGPRNGACGCAFATRERAVVEDTETDPRFERWREHARRCGFRTVHSTPILTRSGEPLGVLSVYFRRVLRPTVREMQIADLCARHAADAIEVARSRQTLRDSELEFRTLANTAPAMLWITDAAGSCTFMSRGWYTFTGQPDGGGLADGWLDAIHPEDRDIVRNTLAARHARREPFALYYRVRRADGSYRWTMDEGRPRFGPGGEFTGYIGSVVDITERKLAEDALAEANHQLRDSERRFRQMADHAPVLIWVSSPQGVEFVNREYLRFVGRTMEEVAGDRWTECIHPEDSAAFLAAYNEGFERRRPFEAQFRFRRADGEYRWLRASGVPRFDADERFLGCVGCSVDITDIKRSEDALIETDRRKDEFLATLAHELRNPLAPLHNSLQMLRLSGASRAAGPVHDMMERQVNHMIRLVDDLLEVSRITRGIIEIRRERMELADVVRTAVETSQPLIDAARHKLVVTLPREPLVVDADGVRLAQVFTNLLNNAAKYTEDGGNIGLRVWRDGAQVAVAVRDDGVGIPAAMLPRVFDLFTQIDGTLRRAQGGLGIGLTLVRRLVEMHGGAVEAQSAGPGLGSEFTVRLPLADGQPSEPPPEDRDPPATATLPRVVVVDDNRDAADSVGMLLRMLGAEVSVVHDGPAALEVVAAFRPELVLMDIGMPGMDGYEVARRIRRQILEPRPRIIALTGWGHPEDRRRSSEAGFDQHFVKPVGLAALRALLASRPVPEHGRGRT